MFSKKESLAGLFFMPIFHFFAFYLKVRYDERVSIIFNPFLYEKF